MGEPGIETGPAFDKVFEESLACGEAPGLVAGVVRDGVLRHVFCGGAADVASGRAFALDSICRIASVTKHFTALTLLRLRDEGRVRLDDPLADYVPAAAHLVPPTRDSRTLSLRDLLTHTAGFVNDDPWADRVLGLAPRALDDLLAQGGLFARPPGVAFEYSNLGYGLLGRVVGAAGGGTCQEVVRDRLLDPLGMASTTFDVPGADPARRVPGYRKQGDGWAPERIEPDGEFGPMGGLATTAEDCARWVAFILGAWPPRDDPDDGPVRRSTIRELSSLHAPPGPGELRTVEGKAMAAASAYGYGLVSTADPMLGRALHHAGGLPGYGAHVLYLPEAGVGLFAFANATYAPMTKRVWEAAYALHAAGDLSPRPVATDGRWADAVAIVRSLYVGTPVAGAAARFAENLLLDRAAEEREAELAAARDRFGACRDVRGEPRHALAGRLVLVCERGELPVELALAPGPAGLVQTLRFGAEP